MPIDFSIFLYLFSPRSCTESNTHLFGTALRGEDFRRQLFQSLCKVPGGLRQRSGVQLRFVSRGRGRGGGRGRRARVARTRSRRRRRGRRGCHGGCRLFDDRRGYGQWRRRHRTFGRRVLRRIHRVVVAVVGHVTDAGDRVSVHAGNQSRGADDVARRTRGGRRGGGLRRRRFRGHGRSAQCGRHGTSTSHGRGCRL